MPCCPPAAVGRLQLLRSPRPDPRSTPIRPRRLQIKPESDALAGCALCVLNYGGGGPTKERCQVGGWVGPQGAQGMLAGRCQDVHQHRGSLEGRAARRRCSARPAQPSRPDTSPKQRLIALMSGELWGSFVKKRAEAGHMIVLAGRCWREAGLKAAVAARDAGQHAAQAGAAKPTLAQRMPDSPALSLPSSRQPGTQASRPAGRGMRRRGAATC